MLPLFRAVVKFCSTNRLFTLFRAVVKKLEIFRGVMQNFLGFNRGSRKNEDNKGGH